MLFFCVFIFFFFFKQKTAYEMRISDWSSDVCSSDLFSLDSGATPVAVDVHFEDGCVVNETVDGCGRHSGIREDPVPFTKRLVGGKIGRASCRERVCQYV